MISSKYTIRESNQANILKAIIDKQEVFRAELAATTGLNKASVSDITKKLLADQLIIQTRIGNASISGGRKPIMLTFNRKVATALSFDVGYDYLEGMLSYIDGTPIATVEKERISVDSTNVVALLQTAIADLMTHNPSTPYDIVGVTIGIHGVILDEQAIFTPYYDLDTIDLKQQLMDHYSFPVFIHNEANLAALGEYTFSSPLQNLISISSHSGIGCGIVEDGILKIGKHGKSGEIGHTILYPNGIPCPCGNHGCLEQYASNKAIYEEFAHKKKLEYANSDIIATYANQADPDALHLIKKNAELLSIGINNISMIYDPDIIVVNSPLYRKLPIMIDYINNALSSRFTKEIIVRNTLLGEKAILFGGVAVIAQHFLNIRKLKFKECGTNLKISFATDSRINGGSRSNSFGNKPKFTKI